MKTECSLAVATFLVITKVLNILIRNDNDFERLQNIAFVVVERMNQTKDWGKILENNWLNTSS